MQVKSFAFFILLSCGALTAQTSTLTKPAASETIRKINDRILNTRNYSATVAYSIYKHHNDSHAIEKTEGYYRKSGIKEHSMMMGLETIQNDKERLVIDTSNRNIVLAAPSVKPQLIEESMQAALAMCHKISLVKAGGYSTMILLLDAKSGAGFNRVEIQYADDTYFISSMTMYYIHTPMPGFDDITDPKVIISYSGISTSHIPGSEFHTSGYIEKKNNMYVLRADVKDYTFFNQLNDNN